MKPGAGANRFSADLPRNVIEFVLLTVAFFALQRLTFALRFPPYERTTIWTPGALLFSALLLSPPRRWWVYYFGYCAGAFAAYHGDEAIPEWIALLAAQSSFAMIALGTLGIRRFRGELHFGNPEELLVFVAAAGVLIPIATTAPIDAMRWAGGAADIWPVALRSALCIALGLLIATPAVTLTLLHAKSWLRSFPPRRFAEFSALAAALLLVGHQAFSRPAGETLTAMLYAPVPFLLYAALRFGLAGVCWLLLALAYQSTWGAIHGNGPFSGSASADYVLQLQLFLFAISLPLMFLAVVIHERSRAFTALARSEQEVRSQYAQLETIYQSAAVGLALVDPWLRLINCNPCFAEIYGIQIPQQLGGTLKSVLPEAAEELESVYRQVLETGTPVVDLEFQGRTKAEPESERHWLVSHFPVQDAGGRVLGVSTFVQDVTARKQADQARRELIHASRLALLGEFTASIAHEINQPLGAIQSNADAAEMLLDANPDSLDEVRLILEDIRRDNLRASEVIRRLRNLLRNNALDAQPLDVNDVVGESLALVQAEAGRRVVKLTADLSQGLPAVRGDRVHLQQVLINLLVNGMDAMNGTPGHKEVVVRTTVAAHDVEVAVQDCGVGIPADRLPHVFDHFFSTKEAGMGLGLAITRTLIERHGGRIWAENAPNGGATFRFRLPIDGALREDALAYQEVGDP